MPDDPGSKEADGTEPEVSAETDVVPAARRALAEAEERRRKAKATAMPKELGGRGGPEPTRFGDWEKDGIAHDF